MNTLHIKIRGVDRKSMPRIAVDGESVKCVKNEFGSYEATVQTARPEAEICVFSLLELRLPLWWLYAYGAMGGTESSGKSGGRDTRQSCGGSTTFSIL